MLRTALLSVVAFVFPAAAQVADLTVDPGQSGVTARICISPPGLSTKCDTSSSGVAGAIAIELDSYGTPTAITLHGFGLALSDTMSYNMDWGFFIGGVDITLSGVTVEYATPGLPTGPVPVDGAGGFDFPAVQALFTGQGAYQGYGPVLGTLVGSGSFNLADFGVVDSALSGQVGVDGATVTLAGAQAFSNSGEINGISTAIDGTATLVASGDVPDCLADFNSDGSVDALDFLAFLNAWNAHNPRADINHDQAFDALDFLAFLNLWNAGC